MSSDSRILSMRAATAVTVIAAFGISVTSASGQDQMPDEARSVQAKSTAKEKKDKPDFHKF